MRSAHSYRSVTSENCLSLSAHFFPPGVYSTIWPFANCGSMRGRLCSSPPFNLPPFGTGPTCWYRFLFAFARTFLQKTLLFFCFLLCCFLSFHPPFHDFFRVFLPVPIPFSAPPHLTLRIHSGSRRPPPIFPPRPPPPLTTDSSTVYISTPVSPNALSLLLIPRWRFRSLRLSQASEERFFGPGAPPSFFVFFWLAASREPPFLQEPCLFFPFPQTLRATLFSQVYVFLQAPFPSFYYLFLPSKLPLRTAIFFFVIGILSVRPVFPPYGCPGFFFLNVKWDSCGGDPWMHILVRP